MGVPTEPWDGCITSPRKCPHPPARKSAVYAASRLSVYCSHPIQNPHLIPSKPNKNLVLKLAYFPPSFPIPFPDFFTLPFPLYLPASFHPFGSPSSLIKPNGNPSSFPFPFSNFPYFTRVFRLFSESHFPHFVPNPSWMEANGT